MRIVIDTNIFISALLREGNASRQVLRLALARKVETLMGAALYTEYEAVLKRESLFVNAILSGDEREQLFDALLNVSRWVKIYYLWRPNLPDESDNHLFELALAGGAAAIVTHNRKDLTGGELIFPSIAILSAGEFMKQWSNTDGDTYH